MRRRPSATDPGIRDGPFPQARKATPAVHQGANLVEEAEPPKEKCGPEAILLAEVRASPSSTVMGGGMKPFRVEEMSSKRRSSMREWSGMLEALELEPAQEAGIFTRVVCLRVVDPELASYAVQVLEVCHVDPFHLPSSTCDCDGGSDLMLQKNKSVKQEMTSWLRLLQAVEIAICSPWIFTEMRRRRKCGFQQGFFRCLHHVFHAVDELGFSKLVLVLTVASILSALSNVNR